MSHVFISYKTEDRDTARKLRLALRAELRDSVWWDQDLQTGGQWSQEIDAKLSSAACVVVLWSKLSVQSQWVQQEAAVAKALGILVPAQIEDCAIPTPYASVQAARLINWQGNETDPEFGKLLARVKSCIKNHSSRLIQSPPHSVPVAAPLSPPKESLKTPTKTDSTKSLKTKVENNITLWTLGSILAGFLAGVSTYEAILKIAHLETVPASKIEQLEAEIDSLKKEKAARANEAANISVARKPSDAKKALGVHECGENEHCDGIIVACQTSGDQVSDVSQGKWLYGPNSEEFKKNIQGVGFTSAIEYGAWSNSDCGLSGSGWHAKIGTCGQNTPGNPGWQRCVNVRVLSLSP